MLKCLKKHFIPHEGNNHQPYFLRGKNIRALILFVFVVEFGFLILPLVPVLNPAGNDFLASLIPSVLDDLTNENRQSKNLSILAVNPVLNKVAQLKAQDMAEKGYFAHTSPEGKAPWHWFNLAGYKYEYAGENLAINFTDSQDVTLAWMNSPAHKANILKNVFTEIGTGIATGTYQGNQTIFVAQVYGKPVAKTDTFKPAGPSVKVVEGVDVQLPKPESVPKVMGESVKTINIFEKYLTSPRRTANFVFAIIAILVSVAVLLKLLVRMDKKHPILITNGLIVLVLIFGAYVANNHIAKSKTAVITSFASFGSEELRQM